MANKNEWVIEFPDQSTATLTADGWKADDKNLEYRLNKAFEPRSGYRYEPDVLGKTTREAAETLGGEIVKEPKRKRDWEPDVYESPRIF